MTRDRMADLREATLRSLLDEPLRADDGAWLVRLVDAIRPARGEPADVTAAQVRSLTRRLAAEPALAYAIGTYLAGLLESRMHRILYAESGTLPGGGFWGALTRRLLGRLLPPAPSPEYLRDLVDQVFHRVDDHEWLGALPPEEWSALLAALGVDGPVFAAARRRCRIELLEAMRLVSLRLAALGSDAELLRFMPALARHESPFLAQVDESLRLVSAAEDAANGRHLEVLLGQCDEYLAGIRRRSRDAGVDVGLVFLVARIEQSIARLLSLIHI